MSTIDNRVVQMSFDGAKFATGVSGTMSQLDRLKAALHLNGASQGLKDVNAAAQSFNSSPMEQGAGRISASFSSMQAVAFGALANIGAKIASTAANMAKSFTVAPIAAGFSEYETKMGSIQTILANTAKYGTTLGTVNQSLDSLNKYADKTIYSFGDMTKNIGLFTNAGIRVEDATKMIKGFSNAAAASGTSAEGASNAAFQLSQALSAGTIRAQDWISLTNVGMGNDNMKTGLIDIAKAMGTFKGTGIDAAKATKDFKGTLEKGWLSADVMSNYLNIMSGDMDEAKMKTLGLTQAQIDNFKKTQATAEDAATKVRTFSQLMGTIKEAVGSGWSESFQIVLGDFNEATDLFTSINNVVGGFVGRMSDARNKMLKDWKDAGGRTALIEGLSTTMHILGSVLGAVGTAFRNIFPATSGKQLADFTKSFAAFMKDLVPSEDTVIKLVRTFEGLFAILHIGWMVIKGIAGFFFDMFAGIEEGNKGILDFTATIGGFFMELDAAITAGGGINAFFDTLRDKLFKVINPIKDALAAIGGFAGGFGEGFGGAGKGLGQFITSILTIGSTVDEVDKKATSFKDKVGGFFDFLGGMASKLANFVKPISDAIINMFNGMDYDQVMKGLQTGLLGGLVLVIKQLGGVFSKLSLFSGGDKGPGFIDKIRDGMDSLTGTLSAMQANLKASMLIKIAAAIGILALSVVLLAGVDAPGLIRATSALTVMFIQLGAAMYAFQKIGTVASIAKLNLMGAALILLSAAILILTFAVKRLSQMTGKELVKGLGALTIMIGGLILMSRGLDKSRGAVLRSAAAMIIMGAALEILVFVVKQLGGMDLKEMGKGLLGVGALLLGLAIFTRLAKSGAAAVAQAAAIVLLAGAIMVMAQVVKVFAQMSWSEMAKGFAGLAGGLIAVGLALKFMPAGPKMLLTAFSLGKVALAFGLLADAFVKFKDISWNDVSKGLVAIGGSLLVVTLALKKMPKLSATQIVSLLALSYAINTIVKSLTVLGEMDAGALGKSLAVFMGIMGSIVLALKWIKGSAEAAASIAVVAGSFSALQEVIQTFGGMDITSLAKGMGALIGILLIMVVALNLLKTEAAGAAALGLVAGALSLLVPVLVTLGAMPLIAIGAALVGLAGMFVILTLGLKLLEPMLPVLMGLAIAIGLLGLAVALAGAGVFLFAIGLTALAAAGAAGTAAIVAIVSALVGLIPMVMEQIGLGLVAFAEVIGNSGAAIVTALTTVLLSLLQAIINVIPKIGQLMLALLFTFLNVLRQGFPKIVQTGLDMLIALLTGIGKNIGQIVDRAVTIVVNFINAIARNLPKVIQAGINLILALMNGIGDAARNNGPKLADASWNMVTGIIDGIVSGLSRLGGKFKDALVSLAKSAFKGVLSFFGINSPSKKFMWVSRMNVEGLVAGVDQYGHKAVNATAGLGENMVSALGKTISGLGDMVGGNMDMTPTIAPVLDLTGVRKDAAGIDALLNTQPLNVGSSYSDAASAALEYRRNQEAMASADAAPSGESVSFVQNNYSPKAISAAETYRNTRSQLSLAKEALKTNAN